MKNERTDGIATKSLSFRKSYVSPFPQLKSEDTAATGCIRGQKMCMGLKNQEPVQPLECKEFDCAFRTLFDLSAIKEAMLSPAGRCWIDTCVSQVTLLFQNKV